MPVMLRGVALGPRGLLRMGLSYGKAKPTPCGGAEEITRGLAP